MTSRIAVLLILIMFNYARAETSAFRIVIDPGHGGSDQGAVRSSFVEAQINLQIALKLKSELQKLNLNQVSLTRTEDMTLSLPERVKFAEEQQADLFISLHTNTSTSSGLTGMEFYVSPSLRTLKAAEDISIQLTNNQVVEKIKQDFKNYRKNSESLLLSKMIQSLNTQSEQKSIIKQAPFFVIENSKIPAVLIEMGFLSNSFEAKKLSSTEYQDNLAKRLAQAILLYKEKSDKPDAL